MNKKGFGFLNQGQEDSLSLFKMFEKDEDCVHVMYYRNKVVKCIIDLLENNCHAY